MQVPAFRQEDRPIKLQRYDFAAKHRRYVPQSRKNVYFRFGLLLVFLAAVLGAKKMTVLWMGRGETPDTTAVSPVDPGPDPSPNPGSGPAQSKQVSKSGVFGDLQAPFRNYPAPDTFAFGDKFLVARYTQDSLLSARTEIYLRRYRPETAVILVADLKTGRMLAVGERQDTLVTQGPRLAFAGGFPAASLIKILTAAAALELGGKEVTDSIPQAGSYHTLYRRQLRADRPGGQSKITLQEAFAKSVNPAFGLLGMALGADALRKYAGRMGFNGTSKATCVVPSRIEFPDTGFSLAEAACGFTDKTTISPWHALEIARAAGDDGRLRACTFVETVQDGKTGALMPIRNEGGNAFVSPANLPKLQSLMEGTVRNGTARKGFHRILQARHVEKLILGGKTGSLDGMGPASADGEESKGRYDWFIGYATLKDEPDRGLAICVMLVHKTYRSLPSSQMAALLIKDWLTAQEKARKTKAALGAT